MPTAKEYIAFDLGAESGRAVLGRLLDGTLQLDPFHRFSNGPVDVLGRLHWDILHLYAEMIEGLTIYGQQGRGQASGIGIDTWGVDFCLLAEDGTLLGNPRHYRDARTSGMLSRAFKTVPREEIFATTGVQFMEINSLYQLLAMKQEEDPLLDCAKQLLMVPDLLNYWLSGVQVCEFTDATTTQFYDPTVGGWARDLLAAFDLPTHILPKVVPPGTVLGPLQAGLADGCALSDVPVIAPACHDTGSAVAAVPARSDDFAYISSGTWSLMGVETPVPVITKEALTSNFTNEGGVCGTFRLLKNIMGLWLVQECRRTWLQRGQEFDYDELTRAAEEAPAFGPLVEPDSVEFLRPGDMPARIQSFCLRTGQNAPESVGEIVRCALESLALKYRWALDRLEAMLGRRLSTIHIVGGGSRNGLLCQLTADATDRVVSGGPVEATAAGNVLMQALALGDVASLAEVREIVRRSFDVIDYAPQHTAEWDDAYARFLELHDQVEDVQ